MLDILPSLFLNSVFDLATLCFIFFLLLLSLVSLAFVFHLRLLSRNFHHLQSFNSLWTIRFLLISLITLWALNELLRLPFFRQNYLCLFFPSLTLSQQRNLCKVHVVVSLGLCEPGLLITLLFLVNVSIKNKTPSISLAFVFVISLCLPILILQIIFVFFSRLEIQLPEIFRRSSVIFKGDFGDETILCAYPLMSFIVFGAFGIWYSLIFSLSCFKVVTLVINKGLRVRIYGLAFVVMIMLPLQVLLIGLSLLWRPEQATYKALEFLVFVCAFTLAAVGEGILVLRPIADSLAASRDRHLWPPLQETQRQEEEGVQGNNI